MKIHVTKRIDGEATITAVPARGAHKSPRQAKGVKKGKVREQVATLIDDLVALSVMILGM